MTQEDDFDLDDLPNEVKSISDENEAQVTPIIYTHNRLPKSPSQWMGVGKHSAGESRRGGGREAVIELSEHDAEPQDWVDMVLRSGNVPEGMTIINADQRMKGSKPKVTSHRIDVTELVEAIRQNPDVIYEEQKFSPGNYNLLCPADYVQGGRASLTVSRVDGRYMARPTVALLHFARDVLAGDGRLEENRSLIEAVAAEIPSTGKGR